MDDATPVTEDVSAEPRSVEGRLRALAAEVPPLEIAELWVFPPLPDAESSAEFFLLTRYLDGQRRALYSARWERANGTPAHQVLVEHGSVPADRVPRLVERLQRRLGDGEQPRHVAVRGRESRWRDLVRAGVPRNGGPPGNGAGSREGAGPGEGVED